MNSIKLSNHSSSVREHRTFMRSNKIEIGMIDNSQQIANMRTTCASQVKRYFPAIRIFKKLVSVSLIISFKSVVSV